MVEEMDEDARLHRQENSTTTIPSAPGTSPFEAKRLSARDDVNFTAKTQTKVAFSTTANHGRPWEVMGHGRGKTHFV